jgi:hypothetical protein
VTVEAIWEAVQVAHQALATQADEFVPATKPRMNTLDEDFPKGHRLLLEALMLRRAAARGSKPLAARRVARASIEDRVGDFTVALCTSDLEIDFPLCISNDAGYGAEGLRQVLGWQACLQAPAPRTQGEPQADCGQRRGSRNARKDSATETYGNPLACSTSIPRCSSSTR